MAYQFQQELYGMMRVTALQPTLTIDMADGVNVREVYGYDVTRNGNQVSARIGDLIGGRKITVTAALDVAADMAMEDDLDSLMMEMEEAAPTAAGRSSVSKSRKAAARTEARGQ